MLNFLLGKISGVDISANKVHISSLETGGSITMPLDSPISVQEMPIVGDLVLYVEYGMHVMKIIKIWHNESSMLRSGNGALLQGEVQYQSAGGGYMYLNKAGDVSIVEGGMRGFFKLLRRKLQALIQMSQITLQSFNGLKVDLTQSGELQITKTNPQTSNITATIQIDNTGALRIQSSHVSVTDSTIVLEPSTDGTSSSGFTDIRIGGTKYVVLSDDAELTKLSASKILKGG